MNIFDDGFDAEDAAYLGGAIGFAEESIRAEEEQEEELEDIVDIDISGLKEVDIRLVYNMNPDLFKHMVNIIKRQRAKWRRDRLDREEVSEELKALAESEELLEELGDGDDS
jgi:hypothetical protein